MEKQSENMEKNNDDETLETEIRELAVQQYITSCLEFIEKEDEEFNTSTPSITKVMEKGSRMIKIVSTTLAQPETCPSEIHRKVKETVMETAHGSVPVEFYAETENAPQPEEFFSEMSNIKLTESNSKLKEYLVDTPILKCTKETCPEGCTIRCPCIRAGSAMFGKAHATGLEGGPTHRKKGDLSRSNYLVTCCGKFCDCFKEEGICPVNIDKWKPSGRFEAFYKDGAKEWCLRTSTARDYGELLFELNGEIIVERETTNGCIIGKNTEKVDSSYAANIMTIDEIKTYLEKVRKLKLDIGEPINIDESVLGYSIDTKNKSHLGRIISHSCLPNVGLLRVAVNRLHPMYLRLFCYAIHPIKANTELTRNHGEEFIKALSGPCTCKTSVCVRPLGPYITKSECMTVKLSDMSKIVEAYLREREVEANIVEERKRAMKIRAELQNRAASLHQNIDKERNENSSDIESSMVPEADTGLNLTNLDEDKMTVTISSNDETSDSGANLGIASYVPVKEENVTSDIRCSSHTAEKVVVSSANQLVDSGSSKSQHVAKRRTKFRRQIPSQTKDVCEEKDPQARNNTKKTLITDNSVPSTLRSYQSIQHHRQSRPSTATVRFSHLAKRGSVKNSKLSIVKTKKISRIAKTQPETKKAGLITNIPPVSFNKTEYGLDFPLSSPAIELLTQEESSCTKADDLPQPASQIIAARNGQTEVLEAPHCADEEMENSKSGSSKTNIHCDTNGTAMEIRLTTSIEEGIKEAGTFQKEPQRKAGSDKNMKTTENNIEGINPSKISNVTVAESALVNQQDQVQHLETEVITSSTKEVEQLEHISIDVLKNSAKQAEGDTVAPKHKLGQDDSPKSTSQPPSVYNTSVVTQSTRQARKLSVSKSSDNLLASTPAPFIFNTSIVNVAASQTVNDIEKAHMSHEVLTEGNKAQTNEFGSSRAVDSEHDCLSTNDPKKDSITSMDVDPPRDTTLSRKEAEITGLPPKLTESQLTTEVNMENMLDPSDQNYYKSRRVQSKEQSQQTLLTFTPHLNTENNIEINAKTIKRIEAVLRRLFQANPELKEHTKIRILDELQDECSPNSFSCQCSRKTDNKGYVQMKDNDVNTRSEPSDFNYHHDKPGSSGLRRSAEPGSRLESLSVRSITEPTPSSISIHRSVEQEAKRPEPSSNSLKDISTSSEVLTETQQQIEQRPPNCYHLLDYHVYAYLRDQYVDLGHMDDPVGGFPMTYSKFNVLAKHDTENRKSGLHPTTISQRPLSFEEFYLDLHAKERELDSMTSGHAKKPAWRKPVNTRTSFNHLYCGPLPLVYPNNETVTDINVILREYRSIFAVARMEKIEKEKAAKQNKGQEMNTNMTDAQRLVEPNQNTKPKEVSRPKRKSEPEYSTDLAKSVRNSKFGRTALQFSCNQSDEED